MTIINAMVRPEVAYIGADTIGTSSSDGSLIRIGKLYPLPHLNAIVAGFGASLDVAQIAAASSIEGLSFDRLVAAMPDTMRKMMEVTAGEMRRRGLDPNAPTFGNSVLRILLVGPKDGKMIGRYWQHTRGSHAFEEGDIDELLGPWESAWGEPPTLRAPEDLVDAAKIQTPRLRALCPQAGFGGEFIMAELRSDSMRIWKACDLP
jgi:hypothetical protein